VFIGYHHVPFPSPVLPFLNLTRNLPSFEAVEAEFLKQFDVMPTFGVHDLWEKARMAEVIQYLRGGISLDVPEDWSGYFPKSPLPKGEELLPPIDG